MAKTVEKYIVNESMTLFKFDNSTKWFVRFKIQTTPSTYRWLTKSTRERQVNDAIVRATLIQHEYQIKSDHSIPLTKGPLESSFKRISGLAIARMNKELKEGTGKSAYNLYENILNRYYIPYYTNTPIRDVDTQSLMNFDVWRTKQMGKQPAQSTIKAHNAAVMRVFDEAVITGYLTATEIPKLFNTGVTGKRRDTFTPDEYQQIVKYAKTWIDEGRTIKTRQAREVLLAYIQLVAMTGIRAGTEVEHLTWGNIQNTSIKGKRYTIINVVKGKTTKYTGTRHVVAKFGIDDVLNRLKSINNHTGDDDLIFTYPNGNKVADLGRIFKQLLKKLKLDDGGDRTLYSLRHYYITNELQNGTNIAVVAKQVGTSISMIETHYSHVTPLANAQQLSGSGAVLDLNDIPI